MDLDETLTEGIYLTVNYPITTVLFEIFSSIFLTSPGCAQIVHYGLSLLSFVYIRGYLSEMFYSEWRHQKETFKTTNFVAKYILYVAVALVHYLLHSLCPSVNCHQLISGKTVVGLSLLYLGMSLCFGTLDIDCSPAPTEFNGRQLFGFPIMSWGLGQQIGKKKMTIFATSLSILCWCYILTHGLTLQTQLVTQLATYASLRLMVFD